MYQHFLTQIICFAQRGLFANVHIQITKTAKLASTF